MPDRLLRLLSTVANRDAVELKLLGMLAGIGLVVGTLMAAKSRQDGESIGFTACRIGTAAAFGFGSGTLTQWAVENVYAALAASTLATLFSEQLAGPVLTAIKRRIDWLGGPDPERPSAAEHPYDRDGHLK